MSRLSILVAVTILSFGGQAFGQGQAVSYYVTGSGTALVVIPEVPSQGFVLTDVVYGDSRLGRIDFNQDLNGQVDTKLSVRIDTLNGIMGYHFLSGIPFEPGASVSLVLPNGGHSITISGYIPTGSRTVPAVSTWGLIVMAMLVLAAGTLVMTRRKPVVA